MSVAPSGRVAVVELRQYTLEPGRRDELIALFEREFVRGQADVGIRVLGRFRDLDDADRFVWMRGFDSIQARAGVLSAFYEGPLWRAHREAANATMRDSDNVLLLRPFPTQRDESIVPGGFHVALVYDVARVDATRFAEHVAGAGVPSLLAAGATDPRLFVTESAPNSFPRLPVREAESVVVLMARFADRARGERALSAWLSDNTLRRAADDALLPAFMRRPEVIRLETTTGSQA